MRSGVVDQHEASAHVQHERAELKLGAWRVGSSDAEHRMVAWSASHDLQPAASPCPGRDLDREVGSKKGVWYLLSMLRSPWRRIPSGPMKSSNVQLVSIQWWLVDSRCEQHSSAERGSCVQSEVPML